MMKTKQLNQLNQNLLTVRLSYFVTELRTVSLRLLRAVYTKIKHFKQ